MYIPSSGQSGFAEDPIPCGSAMRGLVCSGNDGGYFSRGHLCAIGSQSCVANIGIEVAGVEKNGNKIR